MKLPLAPATPRPRPRGLDRGLPAAVTTHKSGGRDLWSEPLETPPADPDAAVVTCLREVLDPEIPISLVDLGLIYGAKVDAGVATIRLTYTATACPCMEFIREDVRDRLETSLIRLGGDYAGLERHLLRNFRKYAHRRVVEREEESLLAASDLGTGSGSQASASVSPSAPIIAMNIQEMVLMEALPHGAEQTTPAASPSAA